ncbi:hypothetical protein WMW72_20750 [Paenibacillus filicis]|uniref:Uncharacterized protein n=1 Tax=Paenibacillus filicis TaxID=669464 RepID=A0ABU9DN81_9BACL
MKLTVRVKSLGRRRDVLTRQELELPVVPGTLRELIEEVVASQVRAFTDRQQGAGLIAYLTEREVQERGELGKVSFGEIRTQELPDLEQAREAAIQAFEDGLYKVFIEEQEILGLDAPLSLTEGGELILIRLTMLAGRLW